nr:xanthine dehydrogenase 1 [Quercus suber]
MAACQGPVAMAAHQICIQVWLAVSLLTDALAAAGQALIASSFLKGDYQSVKDITDYVLKGHPNVKAIHSSKGVGEPPFFLASAVFFAVKDAITAARAEVGCNDWFALDDPATPERIRMACLDEFTAPFISSDFHPKLSV